MVLNIVLSVVFLIAISLFAFFVLNIFMVALKKQTLQNSNLLFSSLELNYLKRAVDNNVKSTEVRAVVLAIPQNTKKDTRLNYNGIKNCALFEQTCGTYTDSNWDCIGFGDCAAACPQEAIMIVNNVARVTKNCCGCGLCVSVCPKKLIELFPKNKQSVQYKNDVNNMHIIEIPEQKYFKFWKSWYRILS